MKAERSRSVLEWLLSQKRAKRTAVLEHQCVDGNVEMWADIQGYEGRYQVSTLGRVKSLARFRRTKGGGQTWMPERIMRLTPKKDTGRTKPYVEVRLRDGSTRDVRCKSFLVHRLVAHAFIKPLSADEQVDHRNGGHADNRVENLRVLHKVEHAKLHPMLSKPNARNPRTGAFWAKEVSK
jgi:hypothetical protein